VTFGSVEWMATNGFLNFKNIGTMCEDLTSFKFLNVCSLASLP
jgi:hypothetical protein